MKPAPNNNQLDIFLSESLKNIHVEFSPVEWSEVEVLLENKQKPLQLSLPDRKYMLLAAGATVFIAGLILSIKFFSSSENSPEVKPSPENVSTILPNVDSAPHSSPIQVPRKDSFPSPTTAQREIISIINPEEKKISDSKYKIHKEFKKNIPPASNKDENKNTKSLSITPAVDSSTFFKALPLDTTGKNKPSEIKTETKSTSDDSSGNPSFWKRFKNRKSKKKNETEVPESETPAHGLSDSLK